MGILVLPHSFELDDIKTSFEFVGSEEMLAFENDLRNDGYQCFVIDGSQIQSGESFFRAVRATLPLDPPVMRDDHWDALADSLFGGLVLLEEVRVAIMWTHADVMRISAAMQFKEALMMLSDIKKQLASATTTAGHPKSLRLIVQCANFRRN